MSFGTKEVKEREMKGKYITYGKQKLKINSLTIEEAKSGSKRVCFHMETEPVTLEGWQGDNGAKGQVGRVRTVYMKPDREDQHQEFNENINYIAKAMGVKEEVKALGQMNNIEEFVEKLNNIITGKYAWFLVKGVEYQKGDGTTGISLEFVRFGFVSSDEAKIKNFDVKDKYHFVPLAVADTETTVTPSAGF